MKSFKITTVLLTIGLAGVTCTGWASVLTAKVEQGVLKGTIEDGLTIYRGIPFAAPPVGDLRWRGPQPAAKWQGVRPADKFAPQCVQSIPGITTSEDCLYLNVWTPAKSASDRVPVSGVDLWRWLQRRRHFCSNLQRRKTGSEGCGPGQHRLPVGCARLSCASRAERGVATACLRATTVFSI